MGKIHTCFVSQPTGAQNTKYNTNEVYDLLIEPTLETFDFTVVRADQLSRNSLITNDLIEYVQSSDLCIFDLSGSNPNVYYECGRRHETGRPYLHIAEKGNVLPFDISGIRTILYDLSDARLAREAVLALQNAIATQLKLGLQNVSTPSSLHEINSRLARIEAALLHSTSNSLHPGRSTELVFSDPRRAFQEAYTSGDMSTVIALLPRLKETTGISDTLISASVVVARAGVREGHDMLMQIVEECWDDLTVSRIRGIISGLVQYYSARDKEIDGLPEVKGIVEKNV